MDPFIGEIRMFGGTFAPVGWLLCNGQILNISGNEALFSLIGTTYGGDGVSTFGLPDLRGRVPLHVSNVGSVYPLGQTGGAETVTLTANQLPIHAHAPGLMANAGEATSATPTNMMLAQSSTGQTYLDDTPGVPMGGNAISVVGGNQPHTNLPPTLAINFIIAWQGIYPSRP